MVRRSALALKAKLLVITRLPLLGILFFVGLPLVDSRRTPQQAEQLGQISAFAAKASALVHELQQERGMSAGCIGSKGASFATERQQQAFRQTLRGNAIDEV